MYNTLGLSVIWIEPIPELFNQLNANIRHLRNQRALLALVTDTDDREYRFNIANNNGMSSSILGFKQHKDVWPSVEYTNTILLRSITLTTLFQREQINASKYNALVIDTQGSELLVLLGSPPILSHFEYIKTEVADFESYEGCCQLSDINGFMVSHGYQELSRTRFASRARGGSYFDIVYRKQT